MDHMQSNTKFVVDAFRGGAELRAGTGRKFVEYPHAKLESLYKATLGCCTECDWQDALRNTTSITGWDVLKGMIAARMSEIFHKTTEPSEITSMSETYANETLKELGRPLSPLSFLYLGLQDHVGISSGLFWRRCALNRAIRYEFPQLVEGEVDAMVTSFLEDINVHTMILLDTTTQKLDDANEDIRLHLRKAFTAALQLWEFGQAMEGSLHLFLPPSGSKSDLSRMQDGATSRTGGTGCVALTVFPGMEYRGADGLKIKFKACIKRVD